MNELAADSGAPAETHELQYASSFDAFSIRPVLWLIMVMPIGSVLYDVSRYGVVFFTFLLGSPVALFQQGELFVASTTGLKVLTGCGVIIAAMKSLRGQNLFLLQVLCCVWAAASLFAWLVAQWQTWMLISSSSQGTIPTWYFWQYGLTGVAGIFGMALSPAVAWIIVMQLRRRMPQL